MRTAFSPAVFLAAAFFASGFGGSAAFAVPAPSAAQLRGTIVSRLGSGKPLKIFYSEIARAYGGEAVSPLLKIAENEKEQDAVRWASLFALARIAGKESAGILKKFMTHPNWMLRDAAIRNAAALNLSELSSSLEARLRDPALVVRTSAVDAIAHLSLKNSASKLAAALSDPANYHHGKPLWIGHHLVKALESLTGKSFGTKPPGEQAALWKKFLQKKKAS